MNPNGCDDDSGAPQLTGDNSKKTHDEEKAILFGKGKPLNQHLGNLYFVLFIHLHLPYFDGTRDPKEVAKDLMKQLEADGRPFLMDGNKASLHEALKRIIDARNNANLKLRTLTLQNLQAETPFQERVALRYSNILKESDDILQLNINRNDVTVDEINSWDEKKRLDLYQSDIYQAANSKVVQEYKSANDAGIKAENARKKAVAGGKAIAKDYVYKKLGKETFERYQQYQNAAAAAYKTEKERKEAAVAAATSATASSDSQKAAAPYQQYQHAAAATYLAEKERKEAAVAAATIATASSGSQKTAPPKKAPARTKKKKRTTRRKPLAVATSNKNSRKQKKPPPPVPHVSCAAAAAAAPKDEIMEEMASSISPVSSPLEKEMMDIAFANEIANDAAVAPVPQSEPAGIMTTGIVHTPHSKPNVNVVTPAEGAPSPSHTLAAFGIVPPLPPFCIRPIPFKAIALKPDETPIGSGDESAVSSLSPNSNSTLELSGSHDSLLTLNENGDFYKHNEEKEVSRSGSAGSLFLDPNWQLR